MDSTMCSGCLKDKDLKEAIQVIFLDVPKPILGQWNFDSQILLKALNKHIKDPIKIPLYILKKLPYVLREKDFKVWVVLGKKEREYEILEIFSEKPSEILGVAIDLGSTTIAFYFYDFIKKEVLKKFSITNPQIEIGEDILTRLHFARKKEKLEYVNRITIDAINKKLKSVKDKIYYITVCGNTVMSHFLTGLPVNYIFLEPYVPCTNWYDLLEAKELGLEAHLLAKVFIFPSAGTYFGGDIIAGLYFSEIYKKEDGFYFFIDVGTNAEVVLGNKDFLLVCSGAAGPALEGGILECGCQAKEGAIERVEIDILTKKIEYKTIGNKTPIGICGSGIIQLIAQMFINGLLSFEGKFQKESFPERFKKINDELAFIVAFPEETAMGNYIYIKEREVKNFLRSKGAMFTILTLLCEKIGITFKDINTFYVAGSFGNKIDVDSAVTLGMLPEEALSKTIGVGNAAGEGALKFLKKADFEEIRSILGNITYIELNREPKFMEIFTGAQFVPNVNLELFPKVRKKLEGKVCLK